MREFKFRAWHEEDKVMVYDLNSLRLFHGVLQCDDYKVMQFTGFEDNNKKEIYESDLISGIPNFTERELKGNKSVTNQEVYFCAGAFYVLSDEGNPILLSEIYDKKIVGNIYENKELLEIK